jgi:two-component system, LytTR family, response regulator
MKIESIIIEKEPVVSAALKKCLSAKFPEISIDGVASTTQDALRLIKAVHPKLIFSDIQVISRIKNWDERGGFEFVCLADHSGDAVLAIRQDVCGFILKPFSIDDVILSVESAIKRITDRQPHGRISTDMNKDVPLLPHTKLVGIPTMSGIEFLYAHEIIRCEGLQKCTRIISTRKSNLVSAYNIGEFKKLLRDHGFFSCHKSHLINLMHVSRYTKEGFVFLSDNAPVPLARRKRLEFLQCLTHL